MHTAPQNGDFALHQTAMAPHNTACYSCQSKIERALPPAPGEIPVGDTNADPSGRQGFKPRRLPLEVIKPVLLQCPVWEVEDQAGDGLSVGFTWVGPTTKVDQLSVP